VVSARQTQSLLTLPESLPALVDTTWNWLQSSPASHRVLTLGDPLYPPGLLHMEDPPLLLYAMGAPFSWAATCVAVVGSRNPTPQGAANARAFAQTLAEGGLTIVSGLALGVDGAAHEGALEGARPDTLATIAVVGTGLDRVYPAQHRKLAHRICERGLILSEYPLGTPPLAPNFPRRNRIIAGLSRGTLVVEAALKSGSLITARLASEQGKDVFAIPGSIHSTQARGCHALIKQGAKLVENAQDILEEMGLAAPADDASLLIADSAQLAGTDGISDADNSLNAAMGHDPVGLDALLARTGLDTPSLQAQLMAMELEGSVARLPGGLFQRVFRG
jgi:DNA processing protein